MPDETKAWSLFFVLQTVYLLFHSGEQDPHQLDGDPADQGIHDDGDEREEFDLNAFEAGSAGQVTEHPDEWRGDEVDQAGERILRVRCHQLKQEPQTDQTVQHTEGKLDQTGKTPQCFLINGEHAHGRCSACNCADSVSIIELAHGFSFH